MMLKRSKLLAPSLEGRIARPHLLQAVGNGRQLILVSAPAGFGKSALASAWLHAQLGSRGWLSLDAGDRDGNSLWLHLIACLQPAWPAFGLTAQKLLQIDAVATTVIVDLLQEDLIEWRQAGPTENVSLVLDDLHNIDSAPNLALLLEWLVLAMPVLRILVTTRSVAFLAAAGPLKPGMIDLLDQHRLMFGEDEVDALARSHGLTLSPKVRRDLLAHTEGWITPIHMILNQLRSDPGAQSWNRAWLDGHAFALTALIRDHYQCQPVAARQALCALALPHQFDRTLMAALTDVGNAGAVGSDLICADTFVIRLAQPGWWKIHDLYRAFLLEQLAQQAPAQREQAVSLVADWCCRQGSHLQALEILQAHAGHARLRAHLLQHYHFWLQRGLFEVLSAAACTLQPAQLEQDPELCLLYLWAQVDQLKLEECEGHVQRALAQVQAREDRFDLLSEIHTVTSYIALLNNEPGKALAQARLAVELSRHARTPFRSRALTTIGLLAYLNGHMGEASAALAQALVCAQDEGYWFTALIALGYWVATLHLAGQFEEAFAIGERTRTWLEEQGAEMLAHSAWMSMVPLDILIARGDMADVSQRLAPLLQYAERAEPSMRTALIYFRTTRFHYYNGDSHTSMEYLNRVELALGKLSMRWTWGWAPVAAWRRRIALRQNRRQELLSWYRRHPVPLDREIPFIDEEERLLDADILSQIGLLEPAEALALTIACNAAANARVFNQLLALIVLGNITFLRDRHAPNPQAAEAEALAQRLGASRTLTVEALWTVGGEHAGMGPAAPVHASLNCGDFISRRERDVLALLAQGKSDKEIADALHISFNTAKTHMKNILRKLDVRNRTEALVSARARGIL